MALQLLCYATSWARSWRIVSWRCRAFASRIYRPSRKSAGGGMGKLSVTNTRELFATKRTCRMQPLDGLRLAWGFNSHNDHFQGGRLYWRHWCSISVMLNYNGLATCHQTHFRHTKMRINPDSNSIDMAWVTPKPLMKLKIDINWI